MAKPAKQSKDASDMDTKNSIPLREKVLWFLAALVMVPALLPLVVGFLPTIYFDIDPRLLSTPAPQTSFGPAGLSVLHLVSVFVAGIAIAASHLLGGRLHLAWLVLGAVGITAALWQMMQNTNNMMLTGSWIAGVSLGLAAVHLGQFLIARRAMIALATAIMIPVGLQASYDVLIQKPRDIAYWDSNEAELLEREGVAPGSSHHELLDRRARSMDATGPFGFSNPLGSLTAGGVCLGFSLAIGMLHARKERRWLAIAPSAAGGFALIAMWYTHSTGAFGALLIAGVLSAAFVILQRWKIRSIAPWLVVAALLGVVGIVLLRGAIGPPETIAGERSLLFRFQYWQAAQQMAFDAPANVLLGVGPDGFIQGYLIHKNPLSPEDVQSAHSVTVDFLVMLGLGGACIVLLLVSWLVAGGRRLIQCDRDVPADPIDKAVHQERGPLLNRPGVLMSSAAAAALFGIQYIVQLPMMSMELVLVWLVGLLSFLATASLIARSDFVLGKATSLGLLACGAAILIHSQIEMAFFIPATIGPAFVFVSLGALDSVKRKREKHTATKTWKASGLCLIVATAICLFLGVVYVQPTTTNQQALSEAQDALTYGRLDSALKSLETAQRALPDEPTAPRWISKLYRDHYFYPASGNLAFRDEAESALLSAIVPMNELIARSNTPAWVYRLKAQLLWEAGEAFQDNLWHQQAIDYQLETLQRSPYNLRDTVTLGDWYWTVGQRGQAVELYERALKIHENQYLDDARQLDAEEIERLHGLILLEEITVNQSALHEVEPEL